MYLVYWISQIHWLFNESKTIPTTSHLVFAGHPNKPNSAWIMQNQNLAQYLLAYLIFSAHFTDYMMLFHADG